MLEHLVFAAYLIFFAWLVTRVRFFTQTGLSKPQLVIFFLLKVMAGILYGWIGVYYGELAQMVDTWAFHFESIKEYHLLLTNPGEFFSSIFHNTYQEGYTKFLASENSWWNDLKGTFFVKMLAIFNVFSFGNYYVNVIMYSFLTLFGPMAIYRVMKESFPGNRLPILLTTFFIPSYLYWTSGLHKDGLLFLGIALVVYHFYFVLKEGRASVVRVAAILLGLLLVLALRNFLLIPFLPALFAWAVAEKRKTSPQLVFACIYAVFVVLFFTARYIHPRLDFPEEVVSRQQAFFRLVGNSAVTVSPLEPTFLSFLRNTPQAFVLSLIRPYPSDVRHLLSLAAATEINALLLLSLLCLFFRRRNASLTPFVLFCLFFSMSFLLMIGYTVNILGAIVRYRSIVLPLLFVPIVAGADWTRIRERFAGNMAEK
ncbi:hypothetical protein [Flavisolibacter nicotianae]|uniref:hypothetical protein n=1 Tax=Flavisolibacter nicotianae TaxID=2364882 RepID=UPI0013C3EDFF|nr:hypothetical protein [Flavisolibacter nicotianae]